MSKTVDQRVVEMRFDNKDFEKNVQTSMSTLEKLKRSLKLDGVSKGLEDVSHAAKKVDFNGMAEGIETVNARFSSLQVIGMTVLSNLTTSAMQAGKRIVSALTLDPIISGFQEYETQINAIQTILANTQSKGTTLTDVNRALDELNAYADQTIYNFTEMTRNIGTFTAAGVDLDKSVTAIKGIANLAAVSGSSSAQASQAMYQLSQALATGRVSLMDWNSVVNAGMGGELFQNALKRTAENMGYDVDALIEKYGSFRDSLTQGQWLTADVLTETLTQLSGAYTEADLIAQGYTKSQAQDILELADTAVNAATKVKTFTQLFDTLKEAIQSGWTQSWEIIIGDFNEAQDMLTKISDTLGNAINESANARNEVLMGGLSSGWKQLLNEGINDEEAFLETVKSVAKEHGVAIDKMLEDGTTFEQSLKNGWLTSDMLTESVRTYVDGLEKMSSAELRAAGYTQEDLDELEAFAEQLETNSSLAEEFANKMQMASGRENIIQGLWNAFEGLASILTTVRDAFREIFPPMTADQLYDLTVKFRDFTEALKPGEETLGKIKRVFTGVFSVFSILGKTIGSLISSFGLLISSDGVGGFADMLLEAFASIGDIFTSINNSGVVEGVFGSLSTAVANFGAALLNIGSSGIETFGSMFSGLGEILGRVGGIILKALTNVSEGLKTLFENSDLSSLLDVFNSGMLSVLVLGVTKFFGNLGNAVKSSSEGFFESLKTFTDNISENITGILDGVRESLTAWQNDLKSGTLLKIATAVGILAASLAVLATIDKDKLTDALGAISVLFIELVGAMSLFAKMNTSFTSAIGSFAFIGMASGILIMASALKSLSDLNIDQIKNGVIGVAGLTTIMVVAAKAISANGGAVIKGATGFVIFAAAIKVLASVCRDLSLLDFDAMGQGLFGVGVLMGEIAIFMNVAKFNPNAFVVSLGILALSGALKILASACRDFGAMDFKTIIKGLGSIGVLLAEIAAFNYLNSKASNMMGVAVALIGVGAALHIFIPVLQQLGGMSWENVAKGLISIAVALAAVTIAARYLPSENLLLVSGALPAVTSALLVLADAMLELSTLSWKQVLSSLAATAGAMGILVVSLRQMDGMMKNAATMLVLSTALVVLAGALTLLSGIGILGVATSLAGLAGTFLILGIAGKVLAPLIPTFVKLAGSIATLGLSMAILGAGIAVIGTGLLTMVTSLVTAILTLQGVSIGDIAKGLVSIASTFAVIGAAASILKPLIPTIVTLSGSIALLGLSCLSVSMAVSLLVASLSALGSIGPEGAATLVETLKEVIAGILDLVPTVIQTLVESAKTIVLGLVDAIVELAPQIAAGILSVLTETIKSLSQYAPQIVGYLLDFLIGVIDTLADHMPELVQAVVNLFSSLIASVIDALGGLDSSGLINSFGIAAMLTGLVLGLSAITSAIPSAMAGVLGLGAVIAELTLVLAAIGALAQIPGLDWLVGEGGNLLQSIGEAIGNFIGGFVGGALEGLTDSLGGIADNLSDFMVRLTPFLVGLKMIDPSAQNGIMALASMIGTLTGSGFLDSITSFFTGESSIEKFADQLVPFGEAMVAYSNAVSGIDAEAVTASATAGKALGELAASLPKEGGLAQAIFGESPNLSQFGTQLLLFGTAIVGYSKIVSGNIDAEAINASATAGKALSELASSLPKEGGLAQAIFGESPNLAEFGTQLMQFGLGLKMYSIMVDGLNVESIQNSVAAGQALANLSNALGDKDSVLGWLTGSNKIDFSEFGSQLTDFGEGLKAYSDSLAEVNLSIVNTATAAIKNLLDLVGYVNDEVDMSGVEKLSGIGAIGSSLSTYYTNVSGIDFEAINSSISAIKKLKEFIDSLAEFDGSGVDGFKSAINQLSAANVDGVVTAFSDAASKLSNVGTSIMDSMTSGITNGASKLTDSITKVLSGANVTALASAMKFKTVGESLVRILATGVKGSISVLSDALKSVIVLSATIASTGTHGSLYNTGYNLAAGLARGIRGGQSLAVNAARNMVQAAIVAANAAADVHSPSRVFYKIGDYMVQGMANALSDGEPSVYTAGQSMTEKAVEGARRAAAMLSTVVDSDLDVTPTITPVLDLNNVQSGVAALDGMLSGSSLGVLGQVNSISRSMNSRNQNGVNADVVSALDRVYRKLDDMPVNQYNVNGITYDDGSNIARTVGDLTRQLRIERRS